MLDTDIASYVIKGRTPRINNRLLLIPPSSVSISTITRAELMYGLKLLPSNHDLQISVRRFMKTLRVLAWNAEAADIFADIRHHLTTEGQSIGDMDMMIAAHALATDAVLVTNNMRHYSRIHLPLMLENWTA